MNSLNPSIHIICGMCGCNNEFEYHLTTDVNDATNEMETNVVLICGNCSTLTYLNDLIKEEK